MPATAHHYRSRLRGALSRYRDVSRSLRTPASRQSRYGLDAMNFFIADVQTGFGTFVAFYLAGLGWSNANIGLALGVGGLAGMLAQIPGGALADAVAWKRGLAALGIVMLAGAALILALRPSFVLVFVAEILHGLTAGIITPVIGAISLGLVGRRAMSLRTGRNFRFAAAGHALTAAVMGLLGAYFSNSAIFLAVGILCIPALVSASFIKASEVDYARARNAATGEQAGKLQRVLDLAKNRRLFSFALCLMLFQLADASMLPLLGENLAMAKLKLGSILMSGLIVVPQIVVAILAPWVGYHSEAKGRRPLLLLGFALEPIRAVLLALTDDYWVLIIGQLMSGLSGATITVLTVLVITDLTTGTGRFNLAQGAVGMMTGIAAAVSTAMTGFIYQDLGHSAGFLIIAVIAGAATLLLWMSLSETKPAQYLD
ncbi:MAG: MFS transporter [Pseudorhodoplanes sp.]